MTRLYLFLVLFTSIQPAFANQNIKYSKKKANPTDTLITLEYFNTIPDTIQLWGCRGEFTYDSVNTKKDKYIILISSEGFAILSINSKTIYLDKISETKLSNKKTKQKYKGQGFDMTLTLKEKGEEYLVRHYNGTLELDYNRKKYIFKITGKFAC